VKRIVVDASVLLAGMFEDGSVRDLLLNFEDAEFLAPNYIESEIERHVTEVARRSKKPEATVRALLEDLLSAIELVPAFVYSGSMDRAREIARRAGAAGDEDCIALALSLRAPVWTLDKDFVRVGGLTVLRTGDIEDA
jgi:predicted nucleic acid-binding protein